MAKASLRLLSRPAIVPCNCFVGAVCRACRTGMHSAARFLAASRGSHYDKAFCFVGGLLGCALRLLCAPQGRTCSGCSDRQSKTERSCECQLDGNLSAAAVGLSAAGLGPEVKHSACDVPALYPAGVLCIQPGAAALEHYCLSQLPSVSLDGQGGALALTCLPLLYMSWLPTCISTSKGEGSWNYLTVQAAR